VFRNSKPIIFSTAEYSKKKKYFKLFVSGDYMDCHVISCIKHNTTLPNPIQRNKNRHIVHRTLVVCNVPSSSSAYYSLLLDKDFHIYYLFLGLSNFSPFRSIFGSSDPACNCNIPTASNYWITRHLMINFTTY
jgi:hypothetical protein